MTDAQINNANKLKAVGGSQTVNVYEDHFKFAQNLRMNLGFDFELAGINWTAEAIIKEAYEKSVLKIFKGKAQFLISGLEGSSAAVLGASAIGWEM